LPAEKGSEKKSEMNPAFGHVPPLSHRFPLWRAVSRCGVPFPAVACRFLAGPPENERANGYDIVAAWRAALTSPSCRPSPVAWAPVADFYRIEISMKNHCHSPRGLAPSILALGLIHAIAFCPSTARAEHEGKLQILLLGDSTTEGSVPRRLKPRGPHLEKVLEQLLAADADLPPCHVINSSLSGEFIRRLIDSGRYDRDAAKLPGLDYIFIRYGLNDRARREDFSENFVEDFHELLATLRKDHPKAVLVPMTVIPFADAAGSKEINDLVRRVAQKEKLEVFDIYPRYARELIKGPNMLNYRRYPLAKIPKQYHVIVTPFLSGTTVEVMANELDPILGHLPGWYGDRHPNLAGYNVIADETAKYLAKRIRDKSPEKQK